VCIFSTLFLDRYWEILGSWNDVVAESTVVIFKNVQYTYFLKINSITGFPLISLIILLCIGIIENISSAAAAVVNHLKIVIAAGN